MLLKFYRGLNRIPNLYWDETDVLN